jgi:uncharacterized membrane protein
MCRRIPAFAAPSCGKSEQQVNGGDLRRRDVVMSVGSGERERSGRRRETRSERIDRELIELLNELRVALPGVQFLFAFLLVVPFQQRVTEMTAFQRDVYFVTLVAAVVATGLLIAPSAQHRVLFRQHDKEKLLQRSHRSAFAGLVVLSLALSSAVLLVVDVLFDTTQAWITALAVLALLVWWWLVTPLLQRARGGRTDELEDLEDDR